MTVNDDATVALDENKVANSAQWDGLHGIITNIPDDSPESLIDVSTLFRTHAHAALQATS